MQKKILQVASKLQARHEKKGSVRNLSELYNVVHGEGIDLRFISDSKILVKCKTYV